MKEIMMKLDATPLKRTIFTVFLPAFLFILTVFVLGLSYGMPIEDLTRDPNAVSELNPFVGAISTVGLFFWSFAVILSVFAVTRGKHRYKNFFIHSGIITIMLLLDDAFLLHEVVFPDFFGIPQKVVYGAYFLAIAHYLYLHRNFFLKENPILMALALFFFALSVGFDVALKSIPHQTLYEDGFKLLGIVSWFLFFFHLAQKAVEKKENKKFMVNEIQDKKDTAEEVLM
jgi:hypothetical protein